MDDEEFRYRENYKQAIRQEDRRKADQLRQEEQQTKRRYKVEDDEKRHQLALERQQLRAELQRDEFNRRSTIKRAEKKEDEELKNSVLRANHTDNLKHSEKLSKQEHSQQLKRDAQQRQHEINIRQGELRAEHLFIQERLKAEKEIQEKRDLAEYQRAEMLAEFDYLQALSTQQEITSRDIAIAREQTERELAIAKENNNQTLVLEKLQHLLLLEQKERDLFDYEARTKVDLETHRIKENEALERRLAESRHNHGQNIQKLHIEFLRMQVEHNLKKDYFTHEQETLLRMRKLARDLGLDHGEMTAEQISEMIMDFENLEQND